MLTVKEMIKRVRNTIHDTQEVEYTDTELNDYLDDANRILRRTAMSISPDLLVESVDGSLEVTETDNQGNTSTTVNDNVTFESAITRVMRVVLDSELLTPVLTNEIVDYTQKGRPRYFYLSGFNKVCFYPVPEKDYSYRIDYIADMKILGMEDVSPYPLILDDFMVEYAALRASVSDEFKEQQEAQLIAQLVNQIEDVLRHMTPNCTQLAGYWDEPRRVKRW